MMGVVGAFTYEFQVTLPVMASHGLHVGPAGFGFMTAAMGVGAVLGGLLVAARGHTGLRPLVAAAWVFGVTVTLAAMAPSLGIELITLALVGGASISFMATGNSTLQLNAAPAMRGRVMALWFVAFQGSTPIGGPIVGALMAALGARAGLGIGAITCLVVAAAGSWLLASNRRGQEVHGTRWRRGQAHRSDGRSRLHRVRSEHGRRRGGDAVVDHVSRGRAAQRD
jgi:MFS family permease